MLKNILLILLSITSIYASNERAPQNPEYQFSSIIVLKKIQDYAQEAQNLCTKPDCTESDKEEIQEKFKDKCSVLIDEINSPSILYCIIVVLGADGEQNETAFGRIQYHAKLSAIGKLGSIKDFKSIHYLKILRCGSDGGESLYYDSLINNTPFP